MRRRLLALSVLVPALVAAGCSSSGSPSVTRRASAATTASSPQPSGRSSAPVSTEPSSAPDAAHTAVVPVVPRFAHVVIVVEENHASAEVLGSAQAPYMNSLARNGVVLTRSYGVTHPSQPNYIALFSGSTQGVRSDSCPHTFRGNNLGAQLRARGLSFGAYSQTLPRTGYRGCTYRKYARKHAPWVNFSNIPNSVSRPMTAFPSDFTKLPRVSFVIPDLNYDMHDGTVRQADTWLRDHLARYVSWARTHNSLLVLTWDEDDSSAGNHIPGVLAGAHVKPGRYNNRVDHYTMLRTIETAYGLPALGIAARRSPITGIWAA